MHSKRFNAYFIALIHETFFFCEIFMLEKNGVLKPIQRVFNILPDQ